MDDRSTFRDKLAASLTKRRDWLEHSQLPQLKSEFRVFQTAFSSLYAILIKKGLIHEDPYRGDIKIGEIKIPDQSAFNDNERAELMSIRLSQLDSQLSFLLSYYDFSIDFLTLERIKSFLGIIKYVSWSELSIASADINTKAVAHFCSSLRSANDTLSAGLVNDSLKHLDLSSRNMFKIMKDLSAYRREAYKLDVRVKLKDKFEAGGSAEELIKRVRKAFAEGVVGHPFYPELMDEIIKEDALSGGQNLRDALLARLAVVEENKKNVVSELSYRSVLFDGIRGLGLVSFPLDDCFRKLTANSALIEDEKNSLSARVHRFVRKLFKLKPESIVYELEYFDPLSSTSRAEKVDFQKFMSSIEQRTRFLAAINNRNSSVYKRFEGASEEYLLSALTKLVDELRVAHRTMNALDLFFKSEASRDLRSKMRGVQPELSTIKNSIVKANQRRHDYVSGKEEQEQLKRLGIRS